MKCQTRLKPCYSLIDLTPLVDVIFLMCIFFMFTSDTLPLKSLLIEHPRIENAEEATLAQLLLIVDKDQVIYLGSKKEIIDLPSVQKKLEEQINKWKKTHHGITPTVVLSVDRRLDYQTFFSLFSEIAKVAPKIRLAYTSDLHESYSS